MAHGLQFSIFPMRANLHLSPSSTAPPPPAPWHTPPRARPRALHQVPQAHRSSWISLRVSWHSCLHTFRTSLSRAPSEVYAAAPRGHGPGEGYCLASNDTARVPSHMASAHSAAAMQSELLKRGLKLRINFFLPPKRYSKLVGFQDAAAPSSARTTVRLNRLRSHLRAHVEGH